MTVWSEAVRCSVKLASKDEIAGKWNGRYTLNTDIRLQRNIGRQRSLLLAEIPYHLVGAFVGAKGAKA